MSKLGNSIAGRITYRLVLVFCLMMTVEVVITYVLTLAHINEAYDFWLEASLRRVRSKLILTLASKAPETMPSELPVNRWDSQDKFYYRVSSERHSTLYGESRLPEPDRSRIEPGEPYFEETQMGSERVRTLSIMETVPELGSQVVITVAETLNKRKAKISTIFIYAIIPQLILSLIALFVLRRMLGEIIKPFSAYVGLIHERQPEDLSPICLGPVVEELKILTDATNSLLKRMSIASESQKRFIANAAHQIRTPLAGIRLHLDRALRTQEPDVIHRSLSYASTSERRLSDLVNKLLVLSEAETASVDGAKGEPCNLRSLAQNAIERLSIEAMQHDMEIHLSVSSSDNLSGPSGNPVLIEEMIYNLIANAIQHGRAKGRVIVSIYVEHEKVVIQIDDDGNVIPELFRPTMFERFCRSPDSPKSGSGLGLSIVREIAAVHGGTVGHESLIADGVVNRFKIRLPVHQNFKHDERQLHPK